MTVAIVASLGAMIIGAVLAHIAGYFGGWIDWLIGRAVDVWMSFPPVILSLILMVGLYFIGGSSIGLVYWIVAASLSATIPIWAAYLPHRLAPENPAVRSAGRIAQIWTPVISSFAYHHLHHAQPKVPTALLSVAARRTSRSEYEAHVYEPHGH